MTREIRTSCSFSRRVLKVSGRLACDIRSHQHGDPRFFRERFAKSLPAPAAATSSSGRFHSPWTIRCRPLKRSPISFAGKGGASLHGTLKSRPVAVRCTPLAAGTRTARPARSPPAGASSREAARAQPPGENCGAGSSTRAASCRAHRLALSRGHLSDTDYETLICHLQGYHGRMTVPGKRGIAARFLPIAAHEPDLPFLERTFRRRHGREAAQTIVQLRMMHQRQNEESIRPFHRLKMAESVTVIS